LEATRLAPRSVRLSRLRGSKAMYLESIVRQPMSSRLAGSISCWLASTSTAIIQRIYGHRQSRQLLGQKTS
jgi:hypothetical protein